MKSRTLLLGALAWLGVVAAGSGLTWVVIDAAGQQVLSEAPVAAAPPAGTSAEIPAPTPSRTPGAHRTRRSHPQRTSGPTQAPAATATPRPTSRPSTRPTSAPPTTAPPAQQPAPRAEQRTWRGAPGTVVARCTGSKVALVSATPNDGYRVEVGNRGPDEVEVTFKGGAGETQVKARCSGGVPQFSTEAETDSESTSDVGQQDEGGDG